MMKRSGQTLIFDADDTLWENNVLFERVIDDFLDWLAHPTLEKKQSRAILDDIEAANAVTHGYGSTMFLRSLKDCFERLRERPATPQEHREIEALATALTDRTVELVPGVADTLMDLGTRHDLLLFTKGNAEEQQRKVDASGLAKHFTHIRIVAEKRLPDYQRLITEQRLDAMSTWMIGNSVKSDIAPARQAGINAVFIPNANTWVLEHEELDCADEHVLVLDTFPQLLDHF
jgi:putative hydrolase of the HAD superfamily